jgi:hypothetical protein
MSEKPKLPKQGAEAGILPSSPEFWREYAQIFAKALRRDGPLMAGFGTRPLQPRKVESLAKDGIITVKTRSRTGFMLVDKEAGKAPC